MTCSAAGDVKRVFGLLVDLISCALFILLAGEYALAIYPVYVTIIIGYGLRYGVRYLVLAICVALVSFSALAFNSAIFQQSKNLVLGFYIGLILIPGYAAILLKKYQDLLRRLSESNAARGRFIANMSHELRTPLHAIMGNAEVLGMRLGDFSRRDPRLAELLPSVKMVSEASEHLRALVDGVLDIASNEAGTFVLGQPGRVDLFRLVRSAVSISRPDRRKPDVSLHWQIDPGVPRVVESWEQHLKAVLINTIGNAVKYTDKGRVSVSVKALTANDENADAIIRIEIADSGVGIPAERLRTIFEPFAIGDDSRGRRFKGTGLGLTITKQYLDEMRGTIEISSEESRGTTVSMTLPMKVVDDAELGDALPARALLVSATCDVARTAEWIENANILCNRAVWDGTDLTAPDSAEPPDVVLIDDDGIDDVLPAAALAQSDFPDALVVLLSRSPAPIPLSSPFVTRVDPDNEKHIANLRSLLDPSRLHEASLNRSKYRILVVDDNEINLESADIALRSLGHDVHTVTSGSAALDVLRSARFDLVFMDMHMPGSSGVEIAKQYVNGTPSPAPVVILTADATKAANADASIPEIAGFLTKPIKPTDLQHAVERFAARNDAVVAGANADADIPTIVRERPFSMENYIDMLVAGVEPTSFKTLCDRFVDDADRLIDEIGAAAVVGDGVEVRRLFHKLNGSVAAMHLDGLLEWTKNFEDLASEALCQRAIRDATTIKSSVLFAVEEIRYFIDHYDFRLQA